ncbi:hypothetical protein LLH00_02700 [bacterium]|nr:hypothetical protein [bacterium]
MMRPISLLAVCLITGNLFAQAAPHLDAKPARTVYAQTETGAGSPASREAEFIRNLPPGAKIALAALVPGLPQLMEGKRRGWAYFAAEGGSIAGMVFFNAQAHDRQDRFRAIARDARRNFVLSGLRNNPEEVTDPLAGGFGEYYEDLTKWASSGDYDNDPSLDGVQPETDTRTYNGHQWEIAKINNYTGTSGGIPVAKSAEEESRALAAYKEAVYPLQYNWDWTGIEDSEALYHDVFNSNDKSYRRRNRFTTVLLANHIVSAIDMLVLEKLNRSQGMQRSGLNLGLYPSPGRSADDCPGVRLNLSRSF